MKQIKDYKKAVHLNPIMSIITLNKCLIKFFKRQRMSDWVK